MASKLGWFQFYPREWIAETKLLGTSVATRGIWHELLCVMFIDEAVSVTGDIQDLAALARCDFDEMTEFINAVRRLKFADVTECNGTYTVISRRFLKEEEQRAHNREKVRRFRAKTTLAADMKPDVMKRNRNVPAHPSDLILSYSDSFLSFWDLYLRKEHKQEALREWKKLSDSDRSLVLADVPKRIEANWRGRELSKIPHPSTYLHQRQWTDALLDLTQTNGRASPHDVTPVGPRNTGALDELKRAARERDA